MVDQAAAAGPGNEALLASLTPEEREALERKRYVQTGEEVVWIEPDGRVRREKASRLYYIQTDRGVFRVSRITREVVEV